MPGIMINKIKKKRKEKERNTIMETKEIRIEENGLKVIFEILSLIHI